jgi:hypothetical protein
VRHHAASSRRLTPELCSILVPSKDEGAGKAGCRTAPMARQQQKKLAAVTTGSAEHPAFPARWFTAYSALSSGTGLSCPRRRAIISRDLASASGGQDHTPSPSASASFVRVHEARATPTRPSHPALNVRDDREAPLVSERGTARIMLLIPGKVKSDLRKSGDGPLRITSRLRSLSRLRAAHL